MQVAYLGLFSRILDWVMSKIFQPVFDFIAWLLGEVFSWLFNTVLSPIIEWALKAVIPVLIDALQAMFAGILYSIMSALLQVVDYMETAFDIFIGIRDVTYTPDGSLVKQTDSLLNTIFEISSIREAMFLVTIMAAGVAVLFAIYATIKSMGDLDGRRPIGRVLQSCGKAALHFMLVPVMVIFLLEIAAIIMKQTYAALGAANAPSLGTIIFLISAFNAAKSGTTNPDFSKAPFSSYYNGTYHYYDMAQVEKDFNLVDIDFLVGIGAAAFIFIMIAIVLMVFVQRLFDIVVLYVISPLFSATIPLDDGDKFSRWRDMFIGKVFSGFGAVIAMRVYLLMIPMFMDNSIDFTASGANAVSAEMNYIIRLLFVLGGAMAVQKSSSMLTSLISTGAGMQEQSMAEFAGGAAYGATVGKAANMAFRGGSRLLSRAGKSIGDSRDQSRKQNVEKFEGGAGKNGSGSQLPGAQGFTGGQQGPTNGRKAPSGRAVGDGQFTKNNATGGGVDLGGFRFRSQEGSSRLRRFSLTEAGGSLAGQKLRFKRGEDGKMHFDKVKVLGMSFKRGADGRVHMSGLKTIPGLQFSRMSSGEMKLTRIGSTRFKYRIDASGKAVKDSTLLFGRKAVTHSQSAADFLAGGGADGKSLSIEEKNQHLAGMGSGERVQGPDLPKNVDDYLAANQRSDLSEQNSVLESLGYEERVQGPQFIPGAGKDIDEFIENMHEAAPHMNISEQNSTLAAHGYEERIEGPDRAPVGPPRKHTPPQRPAPARPVANPAAAEKPADKDGE